MEQITFIQPKKKWKGGSEWNYWIGETAKLVKRPYGQMAKLLEGYPTELLKSGFLTNKEPQFWWSWFKKTKH